MKRYNSVFELAAELDAQGFERDKDITVEKEGPDDGCLCCDDGSLHSYPDYKAYYIHPKKTIQCFWCGRHEDDVKVVGPSSKDEARHYAIRHFRTADGGCDDDGITLDQGHLITWAYDDPKPADWQDYYVFRAVDAHPIDQREWWEK